MLRREVVPGFGKKMVVRALPRR